MSKPLTIGCLCSLLALLLLNCAGIKPAEPEMGLADADLDWSKEKVAPGLFWKSLDNVSLFGAQHQVNVLEVRNKRRVKIAYQQNQLMSVAEFARHDTALAAINGTFTERPDGEPATFLKASWNVIDTTIANSLMEAPTEFTEGAFSVSYRGRANIDTARVLSYYMLADDFRDVILAGPVLLFEGRRRNLQSTDFNDQRMARTCACLNNKNRLLLVTVDGGTPQTPGMTAAELRELLLALDCVNAIHLASGQSTSMYVRGFGDDGLVNRPVGVASQVSNAILIK